MTAAQRPSSEATSLDELRASVVCSLDGVGWACLCGVCGALFPGEVWYWLSNVLHLRIRRKLRNCLIANSRPILLEAYLRRLDSGCVFRTFQVRAQWAATPPFHCACRRQLSPQLCVGFCRWGMAYWAGRYSTLCLADYDEFHAFCNVLRCSLDRLWPEHPDRWVEEWAEKFFGSVSV